MHVAIAAGPDAVGRSSTPGRAGLVAAGLLLVLCVIAGGSSQEAGSGVFAAQLLALPLSAWSAWLLLRHGVQRLHVAWLAFGVVLVAIPFLQSVLPAWPGEGEGRAGLARDLGLFGVDAPSRWSLAPAASAAAGFKLLPALGLFLATLALPVSAHRRLAQLIVGLALASLLLGVVQMGAPQESALNPYPQWAPAMNGFFANPNHQSTLLVVAAVLACARLVMTVAAWPEERPHRLVHALSAVAVLCLAAVALPLTGSRAGVVLLLIGCAAVVATYGPLWRRPRSRILLVASLAVGALALLVALRWMQVDTIDELRAPLRAVTAEIAARHAPSGTGAGSYVMVFEQEAPRGMLMTEYVNHAHNEYSQWWLEAGIAGLLALALGAAALALTLLGLWRRPEQQRGLGTAALVALTVILAHSVVDYPLRTTAMLAVAAVLAGIAAGQALHRDEPTRRTPGTESSQ